MSNVPAFLILDLSLEIDRSIRLLVLSVILVKSLITLESPWGVEDVGLQSEPFSKQRSDSLHVSSAGASCQMLAGETLFCFF